MIELHGQLPLFETVNKLEATTKFFGGRTMYELTDEIDYYVGWTELEHSAICDDCGTDCSTVETCLAAGGLPKIFWEHGGEGGS